MEQTKSIVLSISIRSSEAETDGIVAEKSITLHFPPGMDLARHLGQNPKDMALNYFWLTALAMAKGVTYGNSWRKHGPKFSIFSNCLRKVDRVEAGLEQNLPDATIDGSGDAVNYFALFLQWCQEKYPDQYKEWLDKDVIAYIDKFCSEEAVLKRLNKTNAH
jgi:hypothetical protein